MTKQNQKLDMLKTHKQLAKDESISARQTPAPAETFNQRHYFGVAHQSRQSIDEYIASCREEWN